MILYLFVFTSTKLKGLLKLHAPISALLHVIKPLVTKPHIRLIASNNRMEGGDLNVAAFLLQRDQRQSRNVFRSNCVLSKSVSLEGDHVLDRFQPDWNMFQSIDCSG